MSKEKSMMGVGVFTAIASSLCCITPLVAMLAGSTSMASNFAWIEPLRPWFIGATVVALGFAWYLQLRARPLDDCGCEVVQTPFWKGKKMLGAITFVSIVMIFFPLYADAFYPENEMLATTAEKVEYVQFEVTGMTCSGCEAHVEHAIKELSGIIQVMASFEKENAIVTYDPSATTLDSIREAILSTEYKVGDYQLMSD